VAPAVDLVVSPDPVAAAAAAAAHIAARVQRTAEGQLRFHLALSGGGTGAQLARALASADVDWTRVVIYQVDERVAPDGDPGRNATALRTELLDRVPIPARNVMLMDVTAADLDEAARAYADALPPLDLVHLGLGPDGHTASWPPDQPAVRTAPGRVAITDVFNDYRRVTLTERAVAEAREVMWLVCGADKREPLRRALQGDGSLPATHAFGAPARARARTTVFVDRAAAPGDPDVS
jgi:6-phosphogluconolactonase